MALAAMATYDAYFKTNRTLKHPNSKKKHIIIMKPLYSTLPTEIP
jgi:hypothetical protein